MGGMKDEAKRITIPPLFPRVHVNDTGRGALSQPFDSKTMSLHKRSPTNNKISDSHTNLTEKNQLLSPNCKSTTSPLTKFEGKMNRKVINYPSPRGSSVTNNNTTRPTLLIKQNKDHLKNLTDLDSLEVPFVRHSETDTQANTDLSLQFTKPDLISNIHIQEVPECLENASQRESVNAMKRLRLDETQKNPKSVRLRDQEVVSECSAIDSLSGMSAVSNDVARVIGEKRFWKMRTYMINQQKIFAGQVFELHRLIMVQKKVAKSPNILLENKHNGVENGTMRSPHLLRNLNTEKNQKPITEEYPEHMKPKLPLPCITKELATPIWRQQLLTPPGNQWLVPVMSPSEGLVYKPYAGPSPPPPSAFMVPTYGQDSFEKALSYPVPPHFNHNYFQPPNPQVQRWSNTSSNVTQAIPFTLKKKSQGSNDSTASSPPEKNKLSTLSLFPTEPTTHHIDDQQQQPPIRAIKAVPHNPIFASESAARIFLSIQEERRDSNHMVS